MITGTLETTDGTRLRTLAWPTRSPRGRILLVHGLGEHGGRYDGLARALNARGYSAFAYDHRGHGGSGGRRSYIPSFEVFLEDVDLAVAQAERALPGPGDVMLYGHSMGALILIRWLQTRQPHPPAVILSAPWLGTTVKVPWWKELAGVFLRRLAPAYVVPTAVDAAGLTADPALQRAYLEDPLVRHGISVTLYDAVIEAQELCLSGPRIPEVPTLVLVPLADRVVDLNAIERWIQKTGPNLDVARLEGTLHEPHNDVGREEVFRRLADWLDVRTTTFAPGNPPA